MSEKGPSDLVAHYDARWLTHFERCLAALAPQYRDEVRHIENASQGLQDQLRATAEMYVATAHALASAAVKMEAQRAIARARAAKLAQ